MTITVQRILAPIRSSGPVRSNGLGPSAGTRPDNGSSRGGRAMVVPPHSVVLSRCIRMVSLHV